MGFWSGLNAYANADVGHTTDARGIIAEVELRCRENPSEKLVIATFETHERLMRLRR